jgi:hypothetical protein
MRNPFDFIDDVVGSDIAVKISRGVCGRSLSVSFLMTSATGMVEFTRIHALLRTKLLRDIRNKNKKK